MTTLRRPLWCSVFMPASAPMQAARARLTRLTRAAGVTLLAAWLGGCAVMDKQDCAQADWWALGRADALQGSYRVPERAQACSEHGMGIDKPAYDRGQSEGLRAFCTSPSGQAHGDAGRSYQRGFCPAETEEAFLHGYNPAIEKYRFQQRVKELQSRIDSRQRDLQRELGKKPVDPRAIERLRHDIHHLEQQMRTEMHLRALR